MMDNSNHLKAIQKFCIY